jgi:hypothetical protein
MKIQEMFDALGLTIETVNQLIADMNLYNFQHPEKPMSLINLDADIDTVTMSQMPLIGRAIAKERGSFWTKKRNSPCILIPMPCGMASWKLQNIMIRNIYFSRLRDLQVEISHLL